MKGSGRGLIKVLLRYFPRTEENHENIWRVCLQTEIWTQDLPNTKQSANHSVAMCGNSE
jgi:hypothetical protein